MDFESVYSECAACSGYLREDIAVGDSEQRQCVLCGGTHAVVSRAVYNEITTRRMKMVVGDLTKARYFDLSAVDAFGKTVERTHGWLDPKRGYAGILQFG